MNIKLSAKLVFSLFMIIIVLSLVSFPGCATDTTTVKNTTSPASTAAKTTPAASTPKYGGTLKYADPFFPAASIGWPADTNWGGPTSSVFLEALLKPMQNGTVQPWLATKWEVSSDQKSITLTLREGVKFHDGSDFNATVAKWNLDNVITSKRGDFTYVTSVDILDNYKVRLNLSSFSNSLISTLGDRYAFMVSKKAYDDHGGGQQGADWMKLNPVGTGPFKLESFKPGVSVKGVKFDGYWQKGLPYLDSIEVIGILDTLTRASSFEAGEVDMIAGDLTKVEYDLQQKGFEINKGFLSIALLVPDSANPNSPFSKVKVRQALDYAIDRDSIVKSLGYGLWAATDQYAVPGTPAYVKDLAPRAFNPDKAKQLLAEAGYANGFSTTMTGSSTVTNKDYITAVQNYFSKVGITSEVKLLDNATFNEMITKGWTGLAVQPKSVNANMNVGLNSHFSKNTVNHPVLDKTNEFQALYEASAASSTYDPALVQKVIRYMYDNAMINCVYAISRGYILRPYLHDLDLNNNANFMIWGTATAWRDK
jgi:peptide/nickel transport system substrate-binding protein